MFQEIDVLSVPHGIYNHKGIRFPGGMVLHASKQKGRVVLELIRDFAGGEKVRVDRTKTCFSEDEILNRGYALLGRPYDPVSSNCEHLISEVLGTNEGSPQLRAFIVIGVMVVAGFMFWRPR